MDAPARKALADAEAVIERGIHTFIEVGNALLRIRAERLYRETHGTFEDYCRERWGMERAHAYRQIQAAEVAAAVSPNGDVPNEAVARELAPLKGDEAEMVAVWREAQAKAEKAGVRVTARVVQAAVRSAYERPVWEAEQRKANSRPARLAAEQRARKENERWWASLSQAARERWHRRGLRGVLERLSEQTRDLQGALAELREVDPERDVRTSAKIAAEATKIESAARALRMAATQLALFPRRP
jgi:hypothetical protein